MNPSTPGAPRVLTFEVSGRPATFATAGERPWRSLLETQAARPSLDGLERGIELRFQLLSLAPNGQPLDVDNLCEPVFSSLVNRIGWFAGRRSNLKWWRATKQVTEAAGCRVGISAGDAPELPSMSNRISGTYVGPLPRSARAPEVADWSRSVLRGQPLLRAGTDLGCFLGFGSESVNIGDIATGAVKSVIDCLYPILGGPAGAPFDWRIQELIVVKGFAPAGVDGVCIQIWEQGGSQSSSGSGSPAEASAREERNVVSETPSTSQKRLKTTATAYPGRAGTMKDIVFQAARAGWAVDQTRAALEEHGRGRGKRLEEYIGDLWTENRIRVEIV